MHRSTWLPWLLLAPLMLVVLALPLWQLSGWSWLAWIAGLAGGVALLVMVAAFVASWRSRRPPPT